MAQNHYRNLGQADLPAAGWTTLFTATNETVASSLVFCNRSGSQAKIRIAHRVGGVVLTPKQYIGYDFVIDPNETLALTLGLTFAPTDLLDVYVDIASVSANLFGSEVY